MVGTTAKRKRIAHPQDNTHLTVRTRSQRRAEATNTSAPAAGFESATVTTREIAKESVLSPIRNEVIRIYQTPTNASNKQPLMYHGGVALANNFHSCLDAALSPSLTPSLQTIDLTRTDLSPRSLPAVVLRRALSIADLGDESWLTSSFMNLVLTQFARAYPNMRYFSVDFVQLHAHESPKQSLDHNLTDILGRPWLDAQNRTDKDSSLVFFVNAQRIHWTLVRAVLNPQPELQYFEPMGLPSRKHPGRGLSHRCVPRCITNLLDRSLPLTDGRTWIETGISVVTQPHQITSFDCGVACLLYAEKCGKGQDKDEINNGTSQEDITAYRKTLQSYLEKLDER